MAVIFIKKVILKNASSKIQIGDSCAKCNGLLRVLFGGSAGTREGCMLQYMIGIGNKDLILQVELKWVIGRIFIIFYGVAWKKDKVKIKIFGVRVKNYKYYLSLWIIFGWFADLFCFAPISHQRKIILFWMHPKSFLLPFFRCYEVDVAQVAIDFLFLELTV